MKNHQKSLKELSDYVAQIGFIPGVYLMYGKSAKLSLGFTKKVCSLPIDNLSLSVRGFNALKRNNFNTVGDVIDAIKDNRLIAIRNLGQKTVKEIKTQIINLGYEQLPQIEKTKLLTQIVEENS